MTLDPRADLRSLNHEVDCRVVVGPPSWLAIASAWCAGMALIIMVWSF